MKISSLVRLVAADSGLWAITRLFAKSDLTKHSALDPRDPAADADAGPMPVRSAGPESMRDGSDLDWDKVDEAVDETFPASDPPSY